MCTPSGEAPSLGLVPGARPPSRLDRERASGPRRRLDRPIHEPVVARVRCDTRRPSVSLGAMCVPTTQAPILGLAASVMMFPSLDRPRASGPRRRLDPPVHGPIVAAVDRRPGRPSVSLGAMCVPTTQAPSLGLVPVVWPPTRDDAVAPRGKRAAEGLGRRGFALAGLAVLRGERIELVHDRPERGQGIRQTVHSVAHVVVDDLERREQLCGRGHKPFEALKKKRRREVDKVHTCRVLVNRDATYNTKNSTHSTQV